MSGARRARVELHADPSKLGRGLGVASAKLSTFGKDAQRKLWPAPPPGRGSKFLAAGKQMGGMLGRGAGKAAGFVSRAFDPIGIGFGILEAGVGEVMKFERAMTRMAIAQGKSLDEMVAFRTSMAELSSSTGVARNELMSGAAAYQALTGDTQGAAAAVKVFARVAQATGASMDEVATAGASLAQNLKVDPSQLEEVFSIINSQGKAGAVELADLASLLPSISAMFQKFAGGTGADGVKEMGAALQIVKRNFGSASEAGTGMEALMGALVRNGKKLKKAGVKVFDEQGKLRNFAAIVSDIGASKLMKNPTKLAEVLGSKEALLAVQALTDNYGDFRGLVETTDAKSIGKDFDTYMASPAGKMERSLNNIKLAIAKAFTPERIAQFADNLERAMFAIEAVRRAVEWLQDQFADTEQLVDDRALGETGAAAGQSASEAVSDFRAYGKGGTVGQIGDFGRMFEAGAGYLAESSGSNARVDKGVREAMAGLVQAQARAFGARIPPIVVTLKADGNELARTTANAAGHRTRPGGN